MATVELGPRIRVLREQIGFLAKDLASALRLDTSAVSRIESGEREIKATELAAIAEFLGVSQLAILEPDSLLGRLPVSPRANSDLSPLPAATFGRLTGLAELHQVLADAGDAGNPRTDSAPNLSGRYWLDAAQELSAWARNQLTGLRADARSGDVFTSLADAIEDVLGVDVIVEPCGDGIDGASITDPEFPLILVNSRISQTRALFTLAHELGHLLAGDGSALNVHEGLAAHTDRERLANAFAASFLMPESRVREIVRTYGRDEVSIAEMMLEFEVSFKSIVFRLHNLRIINAEGRDRLQTEVGFAGLAQKVDATSRKRLFRQKAAKPARRYPVHLADRLHRGFLDGVVGPAPLAGLLGIEVSDIVANAEAAKAALRQDFSEPTDSEDEMGSEYDLDPA